MSSIRRAKDIEIDISDVEDWFVAQRPRDARDIMDGLDAALDAAAKLIGEDAMARWAARTLDGGEDCVQVKAVEALIEALVKTREAERFDKTF